MKKLKIGLLFGGSSSEKEVSLEGGRNVYQKLNSKKYHKIPVFVDDKRNLWQIPETLIVQNTTKDLKKQARRKAKPVYLEKLPKLIDFAFVIGHGKFMEDGRLQAVLEILQIPYNGPGVLGAALAGNKLFSRRILQAQGIDVPRYLAVNKTDFQKNQKSCLNNILKRFKYPFIVKPYAEGCSTAIKKIKNELDLVRGLRTAFLWDPVALVEEYLDGMEVTVSVLGNQKLRALPVTETPPSGMQEFLTLEDKFLPGGAKMITPARLPKTVQEKIKNIAVNVCQALHLIGYPRIDMFVTGLKKKPRIVVLEANTLPGITPSTMIFHQAAAIGLSPSQYMDKIIALGIRAHKNKTGPL
jgi:D-alanine-D-alanine ligase